MQYNNTVSPQSSPVSQSSPAQLPASSTKLLEARRVEIARNGGMNAIRNDNVVCSAAYRLLRRPLQRAPSPTLRCVSLLPVNATSRPLACARPKTNLGASRRLLPWRPAAAPFALRAAQTQVRSGAAPGRGYLGAGCPEIGASFEPLRGCGRPPAPRGLPAARS